MPYGPTKFVNGQNEGGRAVLLQATKTDIAVVWPNDVAEAKPVFPRPKTAADAPGPGDGACSTLGSFHPLAATINGLLIGGIYTLVASGLTLIYGVLHIINFAHGSLLMLAMFGVYYLLTKLGVDPYLSLLVMVPAMYPLGYVLYKGLIGRLAHGKDENILLITLGLSIVIENVALMIFKGDTRTITVAYSDRMVELGPRWCRCRN